MLYLTGLAEVGWTETGLLLVGVVMLTLWAFIRIRQRRNRMTQQSLTPHEQLDRIRQARGLRGDLEELMVDVEQLAKRFSAQLDAKAIMLEKLIAEADQKLARLEKLESGETPATSQAPSPNLDEPTADEPSPAPASADDDDDPLTAAVYRLADDGQSPIEIARQLDEHVGKIELILALRAAG